MNHNVYVNWWTCFLFLHFSFEITESSEKYWYVGYLISGFYENVIPLPKGFYPTWKPPDQSGSSVF